MQTDGNFIKIYRELSDHWIFQKPYYFRAWVYILFRANWKDKKVPMNTSIINCKRGEFLTSINKFSIDTDLTRKQVRIFWNLLKQEEMILTEGCPKWTKITVCKYEDYQGGRARKGHARGTQGATEEESKEYKEIKIRETYDSFLLETEDKTYHAFVDFLFGNNEIQRPFSKLFIMNDQIDFIKFNKLMKKYPKDLIKNKIQAMENTLTPKTHNSFYLTLNNWCNRK